MYLDQIIQKWCRGIKALRDSSTKSVENIRKCKSEIPTDKDLDSLLTGYVTKDGERVIISAPEIIIGNVNKHGILKGDGSSTVIIRSNQIKLEGVTSKDGVPGCIEQHAPTIKNVCDDSGLDGNEAVVGNTSSFSVQAASIGMLAESTKGVFVESPNVGVDGHINIKADNNVNISAEKPCRKRKEIIEKSIQDKEKVFNEKKGAVDKTHEDLYGNIKNLNTLYEAEPESLKDTAAVYTSHVNLGNQHDAIEELEGKVARILSELTQLSSEYIELGRQIECLKKAKVSLENAEEDYDKQNTNAQVTITAENTSILSKDGDGKPRDTKGAGLYVEGCNVTFKARDEKGATMEKSNFDIVSHAINLSTVNPKITDKDAEMPVTGNVRVMSKNITLESVDYKIDDIKNPAATTESALTENSKLDIRMQNVNISSYGKDGKVGGKIDLNSKDISLRTVDLKVDGNTGDITDDKLTEEGKVAIVATNISAGGMEKEKPAKSVKIEFAEEISADAKTKLEIKQDEGKKAAVQLAENKVDIKGEEAKVSGKTTIDGETIITKATNIKANTEIGGSVTVSGTIDTRNSKGI